MKVIHREKINRKMSSPPPVIVRASRRGNGTDTDDRRCLLEYLNEFQLQPDPARSHVEIIAEYWQLDRTQTPGLITL